MSPARALPEAFCQSLGFLGNDADTLVQALRQGLPCVSVRYNPLKTDGRPPDVEPVPWSKTGAYLPDRPVFAADPAWHQGRYYVQEASSMAMEHAIANIVDTVFTDSGPLTVLDACSAPGGKAIAAMAALPPGSWVVCNEPDRHRANILAENLARYGEPNVAVLTTDARNLPKSGRNFDIIIADMPCSGEGMMRKEQRAIEQWSPALVAQCACLQREIAMALWENLRPGGVMVYSTCTFNRQEDDLNVQWICDQTDAQPLDLGLGAFEGVRVAPDNFGVRFLPGLVRGEGFFIAAIQKPGQWKPLKAEPARLETAIRRSRIPIMRFGIPEPTLKGRDKIPPYELVLSRLWTPQMLPALETDRDTAISYLRGNALPTAGTPLPRGLITVNWAGLPLGLAKNIGNRANNLLPDYLRLRLNL